MAPVCETPERASTSSVSDHDVAYVVRTMVGFTAAIKADVRHRRIVPCPDLLNGHYSGGGPATLRSRRA
ncbi:MAG: hypothetical protein EON55_20610 [Alphaproteobacteria bacterium]|nr:MAG: hypothetical protein EON55_20610 [Alphaproteobacteria bacterium]